MPDDITIDEPMTRIEKFLAAAAGENIQLDEPQTRIEKYLYKIAQNAGGALPPITDADDGKVLTANSGVWGAQEPIGKKFIVTLTPTSPDYSGTMDKTVAEIDAAYKAGQEIVVKVITAADAFVEVPCSAIGHYDHTGYYPNFIANIIQYGNNCIIVAYTGDTDDGTKQTYSTIIFLLTPAT